MNKPNSLWCTGSFNARINGPSMKLVGTTLAQHPQLSHLMDKNDCIIRHRTAIKTNYWSSVEKTYIPTQTREKKKQHLLTKIRSYNNLLYLEDCHGKSHAPIRLLTIQKFAQPSPYDCDRVLHQQSTQCFLMEENEAKA